MKPLLILFFLKRKLYYLIMIAVAAALSSYALSFMGNPLPNINMNGEWHFYDDEDLCEVPEIVEAYPDGQCQTKKELLVISYYDDYAKAMLLFTDPDLLKYVFSQSDHPISENTVIQVDSVNSCGPFFIEPGSIGQQAIQLNIPKDTLDCPNNRTVFRNTFTFPLPKGFNYENTYEKLRGMNFILSNEMAVTKENRNLYRIYTTSPKKKVLLDDKQYWEMVLILLSLDKETGIATLIIDGFYGAGVKAPSVAEMVSTNVDYYTKITDVYEVLQVQLR